MNADENRVATEMLLLMKSVLSQEQQSLVCEWAAKYYNLPSTVLVRDRYCIDCQHKWTAPVQYSAYTQKLSGEARLWCPVCNGGNIMSEPMRIAYEERPEEEGDCEQCKQLRAVNRMLMHNNKERFHRIEQLMGQMRTMRSRITKLQQNIEQRNKLDRGNDNVFVLKGE